VPSPSNQNCTSTGSFCIQDTTLFFAGCTGLDTAASNITVQFNLTCQGGISIADCPPDPFTNYPVQISFRLRTTTVCPIIQETLNASGILASYSDATYTTLLSTFAYGATAFFNGIVSSPQAAIQSITVGEVTDVASGLILGFTTLTCPGTVSGVCFSVLLSGLPFSASVTSQIYEIEAELNLTFVGAKRESLGGAPSESILLHRAITMILQQEQPPQPNRYDASGFCSGCFAIPSVAIVSLAIIGAIVVAVLYYRQFRSNNSTNRKYSRLEEDAQL